MFEISINNVSKVLATMSMWVLTTTLSGHGVWFITGHKRGVYTTEQKWHGSDKNCNGSNSFCKETGKFYPFRVGSIGAYGPVAERKKVHCFLAKTVGTVPVFVGSVPFLLCRVNAPKMRRQFACFLSLLGDAGFKCNWCNLMTFMSWHSSCQNLQSMRREYGNIMLTTCHWRAWT